MTRTDSSEVIVPTLDRNQRATRLLRMPKVPARRQSLGEVHFGAAFGSGSNAPAGAARSPARKARQSSKSDLASLAIGSALRTRAKASSADHSPSQDMPMS